MGADFSFPCTDLRRFSTYKDKINLYMLMEFLQGGELYVPWEGSA